MNRLIKTRRIETVSTKNRFYKHIGEMAMMTPLQIAQANPANDVEPVPPAVVLVKDGVVTLEGKRRGIKL